MHEYTHLKSRFWDLGVPTFGPLFGPLFAQKSDHFLVKKWSKTCFFRVFRFFDVFLPVFGPIYDTFLTILVGFLGF